MNCKFSPRISSRNRYFLLRLLCCVLIICPRLSSFVSALGRVGAISELRSHKLDADTVLGCVSPDGSMVVLVWQNPRQTKAEVSADSVVEWRRISDWHLYGRIKFPGEVDADSMCVSHDNSLLAMDVLNPPKTDYGDEDVIGAAYCVPLSSGHVTRVNKNVTMCHLVTFSRDGSWLAVSADQCVYVYDTRTFRMIDRLAINCGFPNHVAVSYDKSRIAVYGFASDAGEGEISVFAPATGKLIWAEDYDINDSSPVCWFDETSSMAFVGNGRLMCGPVLHFIKSKRQAVYAEGPDCHAVTASAGDARICLENQQGRCLVAKLTRDGLSYQPIGRLPISLPTDAESPTEPPSISACGNLIAETTSQGDLRFWRVRV